MAASNEKLAAAVLTNTAASDIRQEAVMASLLLARDAINQHTTLTVKSGGVRIWLAILASATMIAAASLAVIAAKP